MHTLQANELLLAKQPISSPIFLVRTLSSLVRRGVSSLSQGFARPRRRAPSSPGGRRCCPPPARHRPLRPSLPRPAQLRRDALAAASAAPDPAAPPPPAAAETRPRWTRSTRARRVAPPPSPGRAPSSPSPLSAALHALARSAPYTIQVCNICCPTIAEKFWDKKSCLYCWGMKDYVRPAPTAAMLAERAREPVAPALDCFAALNARSPPPRPAARPSPASPPHRPASPRPAPPRRAPARAPRLASPLKRRCTWAWARHCTLTSCAG